ncbi:hypothetical protein ACIHCX_10820 [Streptomyces sp. NPDC052043]|uniref:hypothetical protein n=1 Tax=Streptomyces sp. NPDC052043 TaxID=3365684 RepID=UPI0037D26C3B
MQHTARRHPADDLQIVLDHWTDMRDLIDTSTPAPWQPDTDRAAYLRALDDHDRDEVAVALQHAQRLITRRDEHGRVQYECMHCDYVGEGRAHTPRADRDALVLGERPVPLRLHVVDACRAVEVALCALADEIAAEVQLAPLAPMAPAKHSGYATLREAQIAAADRARRDELAALDAASPARWSFTSGRTAVRAAEWLLARINGDTAHCKPISSLHRARIALVAREAARRIERTIGGVGDRYAVPMDDRPCPYCGDELTLHRGGGLDDVVVCAGPGCEAPVGLDGGRRTWSTPAQLAALQVALDAAARRRKRADARARQRAAARARQGAAA